VTHSKSDAPVETPLEGGATAARSMPSGLPRRDFIALSGITLAATLFPNGPVMAGPFQISDFERLIPRDKKLRPEWVASLTARGAATVYKKSRGELRFIGMPIGGICAGGLYIGGDGKLWLWDIFNANQNGILPRNVRWAGFGPEQNVDPQNGANYVSPAAPHSPLEQGFALKVNGKVRPLEARGWEEIAFVGEYPLATVTYTDPACPIEVTLNAYSPFIPLHADDSGLPVTLCEWTLHNTTDHPVAAEIGGWLENACSLFTAPPGSGSRVNEVRQVKGATLIASHLDRTPPERPVVARPDLPLIDFDRPTYGDWKVEGDAFGAGPIERSAIPGYQGDVGGEGKRIVNSHASAPGSSIAEKDSRIGKLTSPPFTLYRKFLSFYIGGGKNIEEVGLRLIVDGKTVRRAAGRDDNRMQKEVFELSEFVGKPAIIEIYDNGRGGWGNIGVDQIVQTDHPRVETPLEAEHDFGTMALMLLGEGKAAAAVIPDNLFEAATTSSARRPVGEKLIGGITRSVRLAAHASQTVTFAIVWHFPNSRLAVPDAAGGNYYAHRFPDAAAVAAYLAQEHARLARETRLWHTTWYDSTLPHWFLDRTFANTSILATTTAHRFATGRFWGWEGIGCCWGTCTHVWHYAQAVGRVFPELERYTREHVDFGAAFHAQNGEIGYRGEGTGPAVDGQCGRILGVYREHQMSADDAFLKRIWPSVRKGIEFLMHHDSNGDGLLDGAQENTLDAAWYGKIAWISSLYAAALRAGEEMATETGNADFAALCRRKFEQTRQAIETELFNGEYFIQKPEPGHEKSLGTYQTCHIDQVHGQSWAWQVGLGRVLDREKTLSALKALYAYNFTPDVGPFRLKNKAGRPYAIAGDGGLIMSSNPKELHDAFGNVADWQFGYFNECMSGFEHQAASHMIAEGLVQEGLAVTRAIHDRYHASRRNPYNEIECSDHYSRAMASYGSFLTACGFEYHGPKGHLGFAPRLTPDDFRAPFTTAAAWGTFAQKRTGKILKADIILRYGHLKLNRLTLTGPATRVTVQYGGKTILSTIATQDGRPVITFKTELTLEPHQELKITLS
jgi:non-lysosomal glucosylceramidase